MSRIFVRERRRVGQGAGRPRFAVVAVEGADLHFFMTRIRRRELERLAEIVGAEVVYLPRGETEAEPSADQGHGGRRRRMRKG